MIFVQTVLTIALLVFASLGPGLLFIRYLRWRPLETLCASIALSFLLQYLATMVIYALDVSLNWSYAPLSFSALATILCAADIRRLWRNRATRTAILAFFALFAWVLMFQLLVCNYTGARWYGDWFEHCQRAAFFAGHAPLDTTFLGLYLLPARPPMMNVLTALLFWQVAPKFELFQVVFTYLNVLPLLPCVLLAPSLVAKTRNRAWLIAGFLALSPMFVQNGTYTWTKAFAAFYVLTALALYLAAWRKSDLSRMVAVFACFATAMLVHYSAVTVVLFIGAHYLFFLFRRRPHKWIELSASALLGAAIFMTWLGWSLYAFGAKDTFGSNTTVTASSQFSFVGNLQKIGHNVVNTIVPFPFRGPYETDPAYNRQVPPRGLPFLRDWFFCIYQTSFPAMLGIGALLLVVWQLASFYLHPPHDLYQHRFAFWFWFILIVTLLSIVVHGEPDFFGVAHICMQPIVLLGLTFAAMALPHVPLPVRFFALVGLLFDAAVGILLHFHVMNYDFGWQLEGENIKATSHIEVGMLALNNAAMKYRYHLTFLGDHVADFATLIQIAAAFGTLAICLGLWFLSSRSAPKTTILALPASSPQLSS